MTTTTAPGGLLGTLRDRVRALVGELAKFGMVGAMSFAIDIGLFNLMLHLTGKPLTSKIVSTVFSATNAFVLNRYWSFRHRERTSVHREYSVFFVLNAVGLGISLLCLAVSHYVLGYTGVVADNISTNGFGLVLGTTFRFWSYRRFVWSSPAAVQEAADDGDVAAAVALDTTSPRG